MTRNLTCPQCGKEDTSWDSEVKAIYGGKIKCKDCGIEYTAKYNSEMDRFLTKRVNNHVDHKHP